MGVSAWHGVKERVARDAYQRGDYAKVDLAVRKADRARKTWARLDSESQQQLSSARCGLPPDGDSAGNSADSGSDKSIAAGAE